MSEDTRGGTITFTIDIPNGRIEELKQLLKGLEVRFNPENQIVAFNDAMMCHSVAMGHHLPGMVVGMNRSLDEAGLTPRIPEDHEKWSIERRQAFLQFAIENFDWDNSTGELYLVGGRGNNLAGTHTGTSPGVRRTRVTGMVYDDSFESLRTRQRGPHEIPQGKTGPETRERQIPRTRTSRHGGNHRRCDGKDGRPLEAAG